MGSLFRVFQSNAVVKNLVSIIGNKLVLCLGPVFGFWVMCSSFEIKAFPVNNSKNFLKKLLIFIKVDSCVSKMPSKRVVSYLLVLFIIINLY